MESIADEMKRLEFFIGDFDTGRIEMAILHGSDSQPFLRGRVGNEFNDGFQRGQRLGTPVNGDVGKKPVFDLVPLACTWREMTDRDG